MPTTAGKLGIGLVSAALTALALYPLYRELTRPEVIAFRTSSGAEGAAATVVDWSKPPAPDEALPGVLEVERPRFPPSAFVRKPVTFQRFVDNEKQTQPDPYVHYRYKPNLKLGHRWEEHPEGIWFQKTNALGLREDEQVSAVQPDLRILIAGDSHTDGVCNNSEAFGNLVEARLRSEYPGRRIESLNAGRGGYSFYHYLGTLERFLYLRPDIFVVGVYGGNDFEDVLSFFHEYNGTKRPPGFARYQEQIDAALEIDKRCLAQSFISLKYFDVYPEQMEVALQAARDITTEILVECLRHSIHPIFVYIPAMSDVEWERDAEVFESVAEVLEVSPEGLRSTDVMADSYLAFLRERRIDVIDMREAFAKAGPGNFWLTDQHMNLRAQQLIAAELHPLVVAARTLEAEPTRRAPGSNGPEDPVVFLAPGNAVERPVEAPEPPALPAPREFDEETAAELYDGRPHIVHDALAGYRYASGLAVPAAEVGLAEAEFLFVTNGQGLREDEDVAPAADLRVVVTGDEHVAGACPNPETFANLAETELRRRHPGLSMEILNAGVAGYTFQNYLGVLRRSLELHPDAFVVAVSTGSDFFEGLRVHRQLNDRPLSGTLDPAEAVQSGAMTQFLASIKHFRVHASQSHRAFTSAINALRQMDRICDEEGIELLVLQLPSAADVEWQLHSAALNPMRVALELDPGEIDANAILGRALALKLGDLGIEVLAFDEIFLARGEPLYHPGNFLINPAAHRAIAEELVGRLERLAAALD